MPNTQSIKILRCTKSGCESVEDVVTRETGLRIVLIDSRGEENFAFIRTIPQNPEALIIGLLYTSRIITHLTEILDLQVRNQLAKVRLVDACQMQEKLATLRPTARIITGICGPEEGALGTWQACDLPPIETKIKVSPSSIWKAILELNERMQLFRQTGGTHGAGVADLNGNLIVLAEDVGRHNAIDRVIGKALEQEVDLSKSFVVSSGRLTSDLALKVAVTQIPILASISAAVDSGIELADAAGLTLIGFVRGARMNVYTHPDRLRFLSA